MEVSFSYFKLHLAVLLCNVEPNLQILNFFVVPILTPSGGKSLYRSLGSIDITAIARSVLMIARDEIEREIRYVIPIKSSLAPEGNVVSFMLDKEKGFQWIGKCVNRTPDINNVEQITHNKREKAKELLRVILSTGDIAATDIMEKMLDYGICERTIRSAAKEVGVLEN